LAGFPHFDPFGGAAQPGGKLGVAGDGGEGNNRQTDTREMGPDGQSGRSAKARYNFVDTARGRDCLVTTLE